jgi:hypothetical protein
MISKLSICLYDLGRIAWKYRIPEEVEMRCNTSFVELAGPMVAAVLLAALLVAVVALGPIAYERWF